MAENNRDLFHPLNLLARVFNYTPIKVYRWVHFMGLRVITVNRTEKIRWTGSREADVISCIYLRIVLFLFDSECINQEGMSEIPVNLTQSVKCNEKITQHCFSVKLMISPDSLHLREVRRIFC